MSPTIFLFSPSPSTYLLRTRSIDACMRAFEKGKPFNDEKNWYFSFLNLFTSKLRAHDTRTAAGYEDATDGTDDDRIMLFNESDRVLKAMEKKFRESSRVWLAHVELLLGRHAHENRNSIAMDTDANLNTKYLNAARSVLDRSLVSLPQRKHLSMITSAGVQFYAQPGGAHVASGIFEEILANSPKRVDVWSVYIDQEAKLARKKRTTSHVTDDAEYAQSLARVRLLYDRVTALDLKPKKMKLLFKKYLDFETKLAKGASGSSGNVGGVVVGEERIEYVKKRAMDFVEKRLGGGED